MQIAQRTDGVWFSRRRAHNGFAISWTRWVTVKLGRMVTPLYFPAMVAEGAEPEYIKVPEKDFDKYRILDGIIFQRIDGDITTSLPAA